MLCETNILNLSKNLDIPSQALDSYRAAIRDGSILHRYDLEGTAAAALQQNKSEIAAVGCLINLNDEGNPEEVRAIRRERFNDEEGLLWKQVDEHPDFNASDTAKRGYYRGRKLAEMDFLEEAERTLRKAGENSSDNEFRSESWYQLGYYLNIWGRYEEAEVACRRSIELDPTNSSPWNDLGNLLKEQFGRYEESEAAYRQAIALDPDESIS